MSRIDDHLQWCARRELRPSYRTALRQTLERVEGVVGAPLEAATSEQLEAWWDSLEITAASRVTYAAHVSSFFRWLVRERVRDDDPTVRLLRPRLHRRYPRPMSDLDLRKAINGAGAPVRAWLLLAAYMGFRACEIAALHRDDIQPTLIIVRDGKGGKQRMVPLHAAVAAELDETDPAGYLWKGRGEAHVKANTVSARANRYLHSIGISDSLHQVRHWFGTNVYRQSLDLRLTQELMGHASPTTTAGYAAWDTTHAAGVVSALAILRDDEAVA